MDIDRGQSLNEALGGPIDDDVDDEDLDPETVAMLKKRIAARQAGRPGIPIEQVARELGLSTCLTGPQVPSAKLTALMSDELTTSTTFPLDADGFLRRQCPECQRELKWRPTPEGEEGYPTPDLGYHCSYCGRQADVDSWFTEAQAEHAKQVLLKDVGDSYLERWLRRLEPATSRQARGLLMDWAKSPMTCAARTLLVTRLNRSRSLRTGAARFIA